MAAHPPPQPSTQWSWSVRIPFRRFRWIISVAVFVGIYTRLIVVHHSILENFDHDLESSTHELPRALARAQELTRQIRSMEAELLSKQRENLQRQQEPRMRHNNNETNHTAVSRGSDATAAVLHGHHNVATPENANVPSSNANNTANRTAPRSRFAYAYIIAGCTPWKPIYRYYIYDILVSTRIQRLAGSTADVIVYVQMAYKAKRRDLPPEDERLFQALNIRIIYLQPTPHESFYRTMLDKFRVLQLVEYDRVLFMDSDVMPRTSLDYLFDLSVKGVLQESLVVAGRFEPANGGFFMVAPKPGSWKQFLDVVRRKEERGKSLPYPHFDNITGWGHPFGENDYYELFSGERGKTWGFYGAFTDQGLLYHWCKYEAKSVSIVLRNKVMQWGSENGTTVQLRSDLVGDILQGYTPKNNRCLAGKGRFKECNSPYSDYTHYTGISKPWLVGPPKDYITQTNKTDVHTWFSNLHELNSSLGMDLNFSSWTDKPKRRRRPLLGYYPLHVDVAKANYAATAEESTAQ